MKYDYLIVGAGLFGSVFARQMTDAGKKCLIIDKRSHPAGNCYTEKIDGINMHVYGPHIFHTNNLEVWNYINKYSEFNNYINKPKVYYKNNIYSFPINLFTLYQLYGCKTPDEAKAKLDQVKIKISDPSNLEEWILSQVGKEIYETFIYGYTKKQWGREPKDLPSSIIKRLPIRLNFNDNYFFDRYQGIPIGGYTELFKKLNEGIEIALNSNYLKLKQYLDKITDKVVYTGALDEYFDFCYGDLEYRSLKFEHEFLKTKDYQGNAIFNYTEESIPFTRITEHKHFEFLETESTIITKEYPKEWKRGDEKYYPINDESNNNRYKKYKELIEKEKNIIIGGRMADYKYYDMHHVIALALNSAKKELLK